MESTIIYLRVEFVGIAFEELIAAEQIAPDQYRLIENPIQECGFNFGTTVSANVDGNGDLSFAAISLPSQYTTRKFIRSSGMSSEDLYLKISKPIMDAGGYWENGSAGLAFAHLLNASSFDLDALFDQHDYHPLEITEEPASGVL